MRSVCPARVHRCVTLRWHLDSSSSRSRAWPTICRPSSRTLILVSSLPFSGWGGVFGDWVVAGAITDGNVHHADVLTMKDARHRLRNRDIDTLLSIQTTSNELRANCRQMFTIAAATLTSLPVRLRL